MSKPFLFLLLGLFPLAAQAQTAAPTSPAPPTSVAIEATTAPVLSQGKRDTIDAIGRLYGKRRLGGKIWLGVAAAGGLSVLRVAASPNTTTINGTVTKTESNGSAIATVAGIFVGIPVAVAIGKLSSFSLARQNQVVEAYRNGKPLPRKVVRRLDRSFFR